MRLIKLADVKIAGVIVIAGGLLAGCTQSGYLNFDTTWSHLGTKLPDSAEGVEMAARDGDVMAQRVLANMYYWGNGVEQSDAKAVRWWKRAADNGDAEAQENLLRYQAGEPVEGALHASVGREIIAWITE